MTWTTETAESRLARWEEKRNRRMNWHLWWAWYPVCVGMNQGRYQWVWLENVYRRAMAYDGGALPGFRYIWTHAHTEFDILKES